MSPGLSRDCPLCRGRRARPVWRESGLRYVRCSDCRLVFSDVDAETYAATGHNAWSEPELSAPVEAFYGAARNLAYQRFLERFPPAGARRLLDVGCGLGYFVAAARDAGWQAFGCDTSASWVARARELAGGDRIALEEVHPGLFGGGFDLVTAWDVLEHIHDPVPFLRTIAGLLAARGRVFIRTPNLAWILPTYRARRHLLREPVGLGPLNHVVYFTADTLGAALRAAGLEPQAWPVLPPPQVGLANRDPARAGQGSPATRLKNLHAATAERIARGSHGRWVLGQDLDVIAG